MLLYCLFIWVVYFYYVEMFGVSCVGDYVGDCFGYVVDMDDYGYDYYDFVVDSCFF